jgi:hypothetical protein
VVLGFVIAAGLTLAAATAVVEVAAPAVGLLINFVATSIAGARLSL